MKGNFSTKQRVLVAALALGAATFAAVPHAEANTGAGATILNTVTVNYMDASGTTSYSANATTSVTVNLVKAAVTVSGMPTTAAKGTSAPLPTGVTIDSGASTSYLLAITANANGGDNYNLSELTGSLTNIANLTDSVTVALVANDGSTAIAGGNLSSIPLGASVIQANDATTISIPGGSNLVAKIQKNVDGHKVIVVGGVDYLVTDVVVGNPASNLHVGNTPYNTTSPTNSEVLDKITLAKNPSGANVDPAFGVNALVGNQVGEQVLVKVTVTGKVGNQVGVAGVIPFTVTVKDSSNGNAVTTSSISTTFNASNLQITKTVRNCGKSTSSPVGICSASFAASATGDPGDILEYKVVVHNAGASAASVVSAQDAVPVYTTLVTFASSTYGDGGTAGTGLATQYFAQVDDGTTIGSLTLQSSDTDVANVGSGDAAGITENKALHFFLGTSSNSTTGGSIAAGKTYTILYRMKMN